MLAAALALAATSPSVALTIDPKHRLIEGVTGSVGALWVSSLIDRQILFCARSCKTLATLPDGLHPFAIAWGTHPDRIWVAADCPPGVPFIKPCDRGALIAYDRQGRVRTRVAPASGSFHPGDVLAENGQVFVSDSQNGAVYRLPNERADALETVVAPGIGKSAQGLAYWPTNTHLIVADYSQGITLIDLKTGVRTLLPRQDGKPLRGVDGLVRCNGTTYFGIYNGASPGRVLTIEVGRTGVVYGELIADLKLADPTQLSFDGNRLLVVADSGWELASKGMQRTVGAPILSIPIGKDCKPR